MKESRQRRQQAEMITCKRGRSLQQIILSLIMLILLLTGNPYAATHSFSVIDMLSLYRIADPQISRDGTLIAFSVGLPVISANRVRQSVHTVEITGQNPKRVTPVNIQASNGRFSPDTRFLYFLAEAEGSLPQVWRISLADGQSSVVVDLPLGIDSFEIGPDGSYLILSMAVLPGKTPRETSAALQERSRLQGKARIYDRLPVRHWDVWRDGTRNHLFVYHIAKKSLRDLMGNMGADCPSRPFGGTDDFSLSPDGKALVFSAKDQVAEEAWSTNYDLFWVPIDGSALPKKITSNPAADIQPRFSPNGKTLAYLAANRPGNEADRFRMVLRDLGTGNERTMDLRAYDAPENDRSPRFSRLVRRWPADLLDGRPSGRTCLIFPGCCNRQKRHSYEDGLHCISTAAGRRTGPLSLELTAATGGTLYSRMEWQGKPAHDKNE